MSIATGMIWAGVVLVLSVLILRWRLGVWDIESESGPPSPSSWHYVTVVVGLVLVGWGAYQLIAAF